MLAPRESVWLLSKEEFELPETVTGLTTLRTSFTKKGLFALNVGIVDPFYRGPISTVLLNFSNRDVEINVGESFFRMMFFEHEDTTDFHSKNESTNTENYKEILKTKALSEFPRNFLDVPEFDEAFYSKTGLKMLFGFFRQHPLLAVILCVIFLGPIAYTWFTVDYLHWVKNVWNFGLQLWEGFWLLFPTKSPVEP